MAAARTSGERPHATLPSRGSKSEPLLDSVVQHQHNGASGSSDNIAASSLEECLNTFFFSNHTEAVHGSLIEDILSARLHHQTTTHGVKRVGNDARDDCYNLGEHPHHHDVHILGVSEYLLLASIEATKIASAVDNDTNDGDAESTVEAGETLLLEDLLDTVEKSIELTV